MNHNSFERSQLSVWIGIAVIMAIPIVFIFGMVFMTNDGTSAFCVPVYIGIFLFFSLVLRQLSS